MQLTGKDLGHCRLQRQPAGQQERLLVLGGEIAFGLGDEFQVAGEVDAQAFGAEAG